MTSYAWKDGNVYGDRIEPEYNAISYTWGRWKLRGEDQPHIRAPEIKGVTWSLPRIDSGHFSVPEFQHVLRVAAGQSPSTENFTLKSVEYLWLDIACIDQTDGSLEMAAEIGRQAKIFKGASDVAIWLNRTTLAAMTYLQLGAAEATNLLFDGALQDEPTSSLVEGVRAIVRFLRAIKSDPWFSSMWTLQEASLCQHAYLVTREAATFKATFGRGRFARPTQLKTFIQQLPGLRDQMTSYPVLKRLNHDMKLTDLIDEFGFVDFEVDFPMTILAARQFRETGPHNREDRVYGIMQVFDLQLGKSNPSADPNRHFTLNELEDELGQSLLEKYPVMSQLHCHASQPEVGKAWRISHHSTIPSLQEELCSGDVNSHWEIERCAVFGTKRIHGNLYGSFLGPTISFHNLLQRINQDNALYPLRVFPGDNFFIELDASDATSTEMRSWPQNRKLSELGARKGKHHELGAFLDAFFPVLDVLLFGRFIQRGPSIWKLEKIDTSVGLLLIPQKTSAESSIWHRIGLCRWKTKLRSVDTHETQHAESGTFVENDLEWRQTQGYWG